MYTLCVYIYIYIYIYVRIVIPRAPAWRRDASRGSARAKDHAARSRGRTRITIS